MSLRETFAVGDMVRLNAPERDDLGPELYHGLIARVYRVDPIDGAQAVHLHVVDVRGECWKSHQAWWTKADAVTALGVIARA